MWWSVLYFLLAAAWLRQLGRRQRQRMAGLGSQPSQPGLGTRGVGLCVRGAPGSARPSVRPTPPSHHNRASEQSVAVAAVVAVAASIVWLPFCDWGCSAPRLLARSRFTSDHTRQTEVTGHATLRGASACIDNKGQRPLPRSFLAKPLALFPGAGGTPQPLAGSAGDLNVRRAVRRSAARLPLLPLPRPDSSASGSSACVRNPAKVFVSMVGRHDGGGQ